MLWYLGQHETFILWIFVCNFGFSTDCPNWLEALIKIELLAVKKKGGTPTSLKKTDLNGIKGNVNKI